MKYGVAGRFELFSFEQLKLTHGTPRMQLHTAAFTSWHREARLEDMKKVCAPTANPGVP
jgi:hypothetical protein